MLMGRTYLESNYKSQERTGNRGPSNIFSLTRIETVRTTLEGGGWGSIFFEDVRG